MGLRGLISFGAGGAILLIAFYEILANAQTQTTYNNPYPLILQSAILGFVSFLLIGLGVLLIIRWAQQEAKHEH